MRYIIVATAIALIAGIALGVVVSNGLDGSASAAPPTQAVEEQNLDGSGFVAVHEQGVADVNVVSLPSQAGRLIELGTQTVGGDQTTLFPLADVSDCGQMRAMARAPHLQGVRIEGWYTSPDGTTRIASDIIQDAATGAFDGGSSTSHSFGGPHRFIQLLVFNGGPATDMTGWIWCAP